MEKLTNREIGTRLKESRANKGYTMQQVADLVGVDRSTVQRYEVGGIVVIKRPVVESICKALGVNSAWVFGESENREITEYTDRLPEDVLVFAKRLAEIPEQQRGALIEQFNTELNR